MTIEVVLLALASTIRPTSLAAVYALVSSAEPRRLMIAYTLAGLAFTVVFGLLIVWAFNGIDVNSGADRTKGIAEIIGGTVALAFGLLVRSGRIRGPQADDAPDLPHRWDKLRERRLTLKTAAVAGPVTHVPGLFYLIALNVIVAHEPTVPGGLFEVLLYNGVWFALPITALAICIFEPATASDVVREIEQWTKRHLRTILVSVSLVVGAALVIRGALTV
jgi:hypothetical protein